jgi:hypothetical protein
MSSRLSALLILVKRMPAILSLSILVSPMLMVVHPTSIAPQIDAKTAEAQETHKMVFFSAGGRIINDAPRWENIPDNRSAAFSYPSISPNPVGPAGRVSVSVNYSDSKIGIESIRVNIQGPSIGSTNPVLVPITIGYLSLSQLAGSKQNGMWSANYTFPKHLPDGNYLYSLTVTDEIGNETLVGPYSGIILDRNIPDAAETTIVSALDGAGKSLSPGGVTYSSNITFIFEGTDKSGVIQSFQCNLDDNIIHSEHGHGEEESQDLSPYYSCSMPSRISASATGNHTFTNLGLGNHTFRVRALDNEYESDTTPSSFSWVILPLRNSSVSILT